MVATYLEINRAENLSWRHYEEVSSTMDVARELIRAQRSTPQIKNFLITADKQLQGRGREGRAWKSGTCTWMGTIVFPTTKPIGVLAGYSLAVGNAVARACCDLGVNVALKWPNDIVVVEANKIYKLGGILIEVEECESHRFILVGIGLNVDGIPDDLTGQALSLSSLRERPLDREEVSERLIEQLLGGHEAFLAAASFACVKDEWEKRSCFRSNKSILSVQVADVIYEGVYKGLTADGALCLQNESGQKIIHSGHITSIVL
jgi:biotin-[acetyl-CoA-carboxylase] ligase BirA-like protein